jgi:uncharacterized coiled-coil protein SlyX
MSDLLEYLLRFTLKSWDRRIQKLEERMSAFDDKLAELDTATSDIADELAALRGDIATSDTAAAAKLDPVISRLRAMATDPNNVDPGPTPGV